MPNLPALASPQALTTTSGITSGITSLTNLLLVNPQAVIGYQPTDAITGKPSGTALLFHYEGEQSVSLESDISDHFVENNISVEDQIALHPETITAHGYIGELNDIAPLGLGAARELANRLTTVQGYVPSLTTTALIAYNEAEFAYRLALSALNTAASAVNSIGSLLPGSLGFGNGATQNNQQMMFQKFYSFWKSRTLFTVQTPWAVFKNMAIKSLRAIQDDETRVITNFEVVFKMIRTTKSLVSSPADKALGRLSFQSATPVNLGNNTLSTSSTPFPYA